MPLISWSDELSVKVKELDTQHQELIRMINDLHDTMKQGKGRERISFIIEKMASYTQQHFECEDRLFSEYNYPEKLRHSREHKAFIEKVAVFQKEHETGNITLSLDVLAFLKDWLMSHIKGSDKKYSSFLNSVGVV